MNPKYDHLLQEPKDSPFRNQEIGAWEAVERDITNKIYEDADKEDQNFIDYLSDEAYDKQCQIAHEAEQYGDNGFE